MLQNSGNRLSLMRMPWAQVWPLWTSTRYVMGLESDGIGLVAGISSRRSAVGGSTLAGLWWNVPLSDRPQEHAGNFIGCVDCIKESPDPPV